MTVNINGGALTDNISFSAVNSHRARVTYRGQSAPSLSVKGGSGMLELGVNFKASKQLTIDFALTGWAGKQRGATAQLGMNWKL